MRCKFGIHARYERPRPRPLSARQVWCRHCLARWEVAYFRVGRDVVRGVERIEDRA
jgi:hypothetical protein